MRNLNLVLKRIVVLVLFRFFFINLGPRAAELDLFDGAPCTLVATTTFFHPAETASKRVHALDWVFRGRRVWNTERAILSFAVVRWSAPRVLMARPAKVVWTASEERLRAAEMALPCNVLVTVLLTVELASTELLDGTFLAQELLLAR